MMRPYVIGLGLLALVGLTSCYVLDIVGPSTAHSGETVSYRVSAGPADNAGSYQFCVQQPTSWAAVTVHYTIDRDVDVTGTLTTPATTDIETTDPVAGYTWTCFEGPTVASGERGYADVSVTAGAAGSYTLRFAVFTYYGPSLGSHNLVVDGTPRYDSNVALTPLTNAFYTLAAGNGRFVGVGTSSLALVDVDGTRTTHDTGVNVRAIAFGAGKFVAAGDNGAIISSTDGETWSGVLNGTTPGLYMQKVFRGVNRFIALGDDGTILQSTDGAAWTPAATTGLSASTGWAHGAASDTTEVIVSYTGDVVAMAQNGGSFTPLTVPTDELIKDVAYGAKSGGFIFTRPKSLLRSTALTDFQTVVMAASAKYYLAFTATDFVHVGAYGELYRVTPDAVLPIGTHSGSDIITGVDDGKRIIIGGVGPYSGGVWGIIELPRSASLPASLDFTAVGQQKTFDVRNEGLGTLYVASVVASDAGTTTGCENATLAAGASCTVTVTLDNGSAPGVVTVTTNGYLGAPQIVTLTYTPPPSTGGDGDGEGDGQTDGNAKEDSGCAAVPAAPFAVLLAFLARRRRARG